jgi:hypothetical protein
MAPKPQYNVERLIHAIAAPSGDGASKKICYSDGMPGVPPAQRKELQ